MKFSLFTESKSAEIISLFKAVFSTSEGEAEGQIIADFVAKLIATTPAKDLLGCVAEESGSVLG